MFHPAPHGLYVGGAMVVALVMSLIVARRARLPAARVALLVILCLAAAAAGAIGGAWIWNEIARWQGAHALLQHRYALDGALLAALVVGYFAARRFELDPWTLADVAAPAVALAIFLARMGCIQAGCCYGRPTTLPWGTATARGTPAEAAQWAQGLPPLFAAAPRLHPTAAYEALAALAISAWCLVRWSPELKRGTLAAEAWTAFFAFRLFNDFLRSPQTIVWPWTPALHLALLIAGVWLRCGGVRQIATASPSDKPAD